MSCTCHILAQNAMGHVILFGEVIPNVSITDATCCNLAFQYGNTSLWLTHNELRWLARRVSQLDPENLYQGNPPQDRIQFAIPSTNLKISFLPNELFSLEQLLTKAVIGLRWHEILIKSVN